MQDTICTDKSANSTQKHANSTQKPVKVRNSCTLSGYHRVPITQLEQRGYPWDDEWTRDVLSNKKNLVYKLQIGLSRLLFS